MSLLSNIKPSSDLFQGMHAEMRLKQYPQGCGKGHDTAVLSAWLFDAVQQVDPSTVEVSCM